MRNNRIYHGLQVFINLCHIVLHMGRYVNDLYLPVPVRLAQVLELADLNVFKVLVPLTSFSIPVIILSIVDV